MSDNIRVGLTRLGDGALQQRFEASLEKVVENILDPNTSLKKRSVIMQIDLIPDKHRQSVELDMQVKEKLQPQESVFADILIDSDLKGNVEARELLSEAPGQTRMNFDKKEPRLETDVGEDIEKIEKEEKGYTEEDVNENGELINFRQKG